MRILGENEAELVGPLTLADYGVNLGNLNGRFKKYELVATRGTLLGLIAEEKLKKLRNEKKAYKLVGDGISETETIGGYRPRIFYSLE